MHEIVRERTGPILDIANLNVRCVIKTAWLLASQIRQAIRGTSAVMILQSSRPANRGKHRRVRGNFVGRILGLIPFARIELYRGYTGRNFQQIILINAILEAYFVGNSV